MIEDHFIFPLTTVLFPGAALPLKIFEQRYIEMTKICIRDERPFGVCLIKEGKEVGAPAVPERIGCLARIEKWDMPQLGVFHLLARGGERFRLHDSRVAPNGLMSASVERLSAETPQPQVDPACRQVLKLIIERIGESHFPAPLALDDASWVSYRLAETLPIEMHVRQALLEIESSGERLQRLRDILTQEGLIAHDQ
jgi:Lon protease-like protein